MRWSRDLRDVDAHASLWVLIPRLVASLTVSSAIILFAFYFTFGELPVFPFAVVIFLDVMVTLVIIGDRFAAQKEPEADQRAVFGILDKIGGFWLFACIFSPLSSWGIANLGKFAANNQQIILIIAGSISLIIPLLTMLPNIRYVNGRSAYIQIPIIIIVTALPMLVGFYYLDLLLRS